MTGRLTGVSSITRRPFCLLNQWKRSINEPQAHTCANSAAAELVTSQLIVFPEQKIRLPGRCIPIKFHSNSNESTHLQQIQSEMCWIRTSTFQPEIPEVGDWDQPVAQISGRVDAGAKWSQLPVKRIFPRHCDNSSNQATIFIQIWQAAISHWTPSTTSNVFGFIRRCAYCVPTWRHLIASDGHCRYLGHGVTWTEPDFDHRIQHTLKYIQHKFDENQTIRWFVIEFLLISWFSKFGQSSTFF